MSLHGSIEDCKRNAYEQYRITQNNQHTQKPFHPRKGSANTFFDSI